METEAEVPPATKQVRFVGLENMDLQSTRSRSVRNPGNRRRSQWTAPGLSTAERKKFVEFRRSFGPRIAHSGDDELRGFDLSEDEEYLLRQRKVTCGLPLNEVKEAAMALFWSNTELLKLYQEIMEVLQTFGTPTLREKAVNESMKLVANFRGTRGYARQIADCCKAEDERGVEFMFWVSACRAIAVRYEYRAEAVNAINRQMIICAAPPRRVPSTPSSQSP
jgi:hypothetical protein